MRILSVLLICFAFWQAPCSAQGPTILCDFYAPILMDAQLNNRIAHADVPHGDTYLFMAKAGTNGGEIATNRGIIKFDLSSLPSSLTIDSALISLTYHPTTVNNQHQWTSGSNACVLQRVLESWHSDSVTWNNAPAITTESQVTLPQTATATQNTGDIDVTQIAQKWVSQPDSNFGFLFRLVNEEGYRRQTYASSDDGTIANHPVLRVVYSCGQLGQKDVESQHRVRVVGDIIQVQSNEPISTLRLYDLRGNMVQSTFDSQLNTINLSQGIYIVRSTFENGSELSKKVFVNP
ncbi:MAG: DNRLRE domain-containing protein [Flavobacteriales bacterium]|jgi:hypothetical protein|nr:DNRLRE domain-containing protein [Flavobacteriales bacterium]